ncbi:hypothetical protein [Burkholderia pseudomultivorans]|uniref:hypothetical protein n=1 Tax=Burkholderia pseudomultivorans TaxID=1207504 RepID=UPI000AE84489|nr:hypothetical protein [Burkholderia pseudomultivorans]
MPRCASSFARFVAHDDVLPWRHPALVDRNLAILSGEPLAAFIVDATRTVSMLPA